jgi:GGDEF domain-containing protein/CHASE3 domain sensor protein
MKLTIYRKLLLSYLAMALLTVLAAAYAIYSLQRLNEIAYRIINEDVAVVDVSKQLVDTLIARQSAEKRFLILRDPSLAEIYRTRSREFAARLGDLAKSRFPGAAEASARIAVLHGQHEAAFSREVALIQANRTEDAQAISEGDGTAAIDEMALLLRGLQKRAERDVDLRMNEIKEQGLKASRVTVYLSLGSLVVALAIVMLVTTNISRPLGRLEKATALIAEGKFDTDLRLDRDDEIGSLARAFGAMAQRLKLLEERSRDASPLTGLPGNRAIEREIERRQAEKSRFSLCHIDLDNFKPFADKYGYAWGSEVIKEVADLLAAELKRVGRAGDFLGHIGGDDFVFIADPVRAEELCRRTVAGFEDRIHRFYSQEDRDQGYFIGMDRKGVLQRFPLITVTIAIVSDDGSRFRNPLDMAEAAAHLKEYAKTLPGNNYVTERDREKA